MPILHGVKWKKTKGVLWYVKDVKGTICSEVNIKFNPWNRKYKNLYLKSIFCRVWSSFGFLYYHGNHTLSVADRYFIGTGGFARRYCKRKYNFWSHWIPQSSQNSSHNFPSKFTHRQGPDHGRRDLGGRRWVSHARDGCQSHLKGFQKLCFLISDSSVFECEWFATFSFFCVQFVQAALVGWVLNWWIMTRLAY